jgi:hypothetical protein
MLFDIVFAVLPDAVPTADAPGGCDSEVGSRVCERLSEPSAWDNGLRELRGILEAWYLLS